MAEQNPIYERLGDLKRVFQLVLEEIVKDQKEKYCRSPELTIFCGKISIPIQKYLERIFKYVNCSGSCFIIAIILIERIRETFPEFRITSRNVHKIFMTAVVVAIKAYDDNYFQQEFYAKIAGIERIELYHLQCKFMKLINHRALVSDQSFLQYVQKFESFYEENTDTIQRMKKSEELKQEKMRKTLMKENVQK